MRRGRSQFHSAAPDEHYWPSFTDMMSMVVLVFLFISIIAFVRSIADANEQAQVKKEFAQAVQVKQQIPDIINQKLEDQVAVIKLPEVLITPFLFRVTYCLIRQVQQSVH